MFLALTACFSNLDTSKDAIILPHLAPHTEPVLTKYSTDISRSGFNLEKNHRRVNSTQNIQQFLLLIYL
jgi:hypothetical protein